MDVIELTEAQKIIFSNDQRIADEDAAHCEKCNGIADISECLNSAKGCQYVVCHYPDGMPYLAIRECQHNKRLKAEHRMKAMLGAANLGARFWSRTFDNFMLNAGNTKAYEAAQAYAATFGKSKRWLILSGPVGTGKTHLAVAVLIEAIKQGYEPLFAPMVDMLARMRSSYQAEDTRQYTEGLQNAFPLVIDDLGKERSDDKAKEFIFQILNGRYEGDMPTIITTNLTGQQIVTNYGVAIMSRIQEVGDIVIIGGDDYRVRMADNAR